MSVYAFKGFDKDLKCRGFQYEIGKTYSMPEKPEICERGFHCCTQLSDVFQYYPLWTWPVDYNGFLIPGAPRSPSENRYCVVEACGDVDIEGAAFGSSSKIATNSITILQELTIDDIINILEQEADEAKRVYISVTGIREELKRVNQPESERRQRAWPRGTM